ncbi:hypothetical protein BaRGS_00009117 [Batillaria attramentaria]|uniref:Nudix hydrolase domain-containing protein n=1 Tax=Batillaria attramentaria TaxID=370345 RepID=A0ABD0LJ36_9CAEN
MTRPTRRFVVTVHEAFLFRGRFSRFHYHAASRSACTEKMASRSDSFTAGLHRLVDRCNSFLRKGSSRKDCLGFFVDGTQLGFVRPEVVRKLRQFPDVFDVVQPEGQGGEGGLSAGVHLSQSLVVKQPDERTAAVAEAMEILHKQNEFVSLRGWYNEMYNVAKTFSSKPLFQIERSASPLFGLVTYGCHINGYTHDESGQLLMWIGKRSPHKAVYPGLYDNMCAGGLGAGLGVRENAWKECQEEASVPDHLLEKLQYCGSVSYCYEDERGVLPEVEFIFDLELPRDFQPVNADSEMEKFELLPILEVKEMIVRDGWKPNCALVILDFLIRHGIMTPDKEGQAAGARRQGPVAGPGDSLCPPGFVKLQNRHCYRYFSHSSTWVEAQDNGTLFSFLSVQLIASEKPATSTHTWLSGQDMLGLWAWSGHGYSAWQDMPYTAWASAQPPTQGGQDNTIRCLASENGEWKAEDCSQQLPFVCKWDGVVTEIVSPEELTAKRCHCRMPTQYPSVISVMPTVFQVRTSYTHTG